MEKYELGNDIKVMYVQVSSFPAGIEAAYKELEKKLPSVDNRTFYGISYGSENGTIIYKAAATQLPDDNPEQLELDTFVIKKGIYFSELIRDFMKNIPQIGVTFQKMLEHPLLDTNSYCLEWYKGKDVLCLVKLDLSKEKQTAESA